MFDHVINLAPPLKRPTVMELENAEQEMLQLLDAALAVEKDCNEFRGSERAKQKKEAERLGRKITALVDRRQQLETNGDGLLARWTYNEEELGLLENQQKAHVEGSNSVIRKEREDLEVVRDTQQRLQTLVQLVENPEGLIGPMPPATFVMDNFQDRKADNELWYSPAFYSHPMGYKMCIHVYPNGHKEGLGTHLSVFSAILPGEFDDVLQWPFCGEITIFLLNQLQNQNHVSYTVQFTTRDSMKYRQRPDPNVVVDPGLAQSWGTMTMVDHHSLQVQPPLGCQYLVDDCLKFQVWKVHIF